MLKQTFLIPFFHIIQNFVTFVSTEMLCTDSPTSLLWSSKTLNQDAALWHFGEKLHPLLLCLKCSLGTRNVALIEQRNCVVLFWASQ